MNAPFTPTKRHVAPDLDDALVAAAEKLDPNLSTTVEQLLTALKRAGQMVQQAQVHAAFSKAFIEQYGAYSKIGSGEIT